MFDINNKCHECYDFIEKEYFNTSHKTEKCDCAAFPSYEFVVFNQFGVYIHFMNYLNSSITTK